MEKREWKRLYIAGVILLYEGFTVNNAPCGVGTSYFSNGNIYQEGIFGIKGLLCGREYYPSGNLRFEGTYVLNTGYGPNYPQYGKFKSDDGKTTYEGEMKIYRSGLGYPIVKEPKEMEHVVQENHPCVPVLLWNNETA